MTFFFFASIPKALLQTPHGTSAKEDHEVQGICLMSTRCGSASWSVPDWLAVASTSASHTPHPSKPHPESAGRCWWQP